MWMLASGAVAEATDVGFVPAVVHQTTVVSPAEPLLEFADRELESGGEVRAVRFGAHRRASSAAGDLDTVARLGPARVLVVVDHDVEWTTWLL